MPPDINIATVNDIEALTGVEIESKKQSIPQIIGDVEIDHLCRLHRWQTYFAGQSPQTSKPERLVLKAIVSHKPVGYIAGHLTTRYDMDAEIQSFYVLKEYQRNGIGTALLAGLVNWLITLNAGSLCVGILPENPYKAFYLKYGGRYFNPHWIFWNDMTLLRSMLIKFP